MRQDKFRQITGVSDIFIINLDKRKDRYKKMEIQMSQLFIKEYTRFSAIHGERLKEDKLDTIDETALNRLIVGEREHHEELSSFNCVGVFYSHLALLEKVSKMEPNKKTFILEDDVVLHEDTINMLGSVWSDIPRDYDIIHIGFFPLVKDESEVMHVSEHIARYLHFWSMAGYIITPKGANKILQEFNRDGKIRFQFDAFVRSMIENNKLTSYFIVPPIATFDKIEGVMSDVQHMNRPDLKLIKFNDDLSSLMK